MSMVKFTYGLSDSGGWVDVAEEIADSAGVEITPELAEKIGRPFYEVTLFCTLDTETGKVTIDEAQGRAG